MLLYLIHGQYHNILLCGMWLSLNWHLCMCVCWQFLHRCLSHQMPGFNNLICDLQKNLVYSMFSMQHVTWPRKKSSKFYSFKISDWLRVISVLGIDRVWYVTCNCCDGAELCVCQLFSDITHTAKNLLEHHLQTLHRKLCPVFMRIWHHLHDGYFWWLSLTDRDPPQQA